jgi:general secretion pathway protein C
MSARLPAFVIWALVGASAAFWGLRLAVQPVPPPPHVVATADALTTSGDLTRLLGARTATAAAAAAAPEAVSRYRLLGIVAAREPQSHQGVALIAIDGKPARAFPVGAIVEGDLVLQSVSLRTAAIGPAQGRQTLVLEVPRLPVPATGTLPPPGLPTGLPAPLPAGLPPPMSGAMPPPMPPALATPPSSGNVAPAVPVLPNAGGSAPVVPGASPAVPMPPGVPPGTVSREGEQTQ